jgi:error-prone DNA polymerase
MLTCIRKALDLVAAHHGVRHDLASVPQEDPLTYAMLSKGDSVGVFQVESRAQMNMLPRLRPRTFYDLVIEVAIVRPGPIRATWCIPISAAARDRVVEYPPPAPPHPPDELKQILGRTLGRADLPRAGDEDRHDRGRVHGQGGQRARKAMATFRSKGTIGRLEERMVGRMVERGYDPDFARRCFDQIKGFGEYGFPESHAASFALLVYVSAWLKCHFPAAFGAALLNSQPMGFYAPAQIVRDMQEHGVEVRAPDANHSDWDTGLVPDGRGGVAVRLGLRLITGFPQTAAHRLVAARAGPYRNLLDIQDRAGLPVALLRRLAEADALRSLGLDRRQALWEAKAPARCARPAAVRGRPRRG